MDRKLDAKLVKDFPLLFGDRHADMRTTCMCWGFSCGDGWYKLIRSVAERLEPLIEKYRKEYPDEDYPRASQVKEKFGRLRFYMTHATDEMYKIIDDAERLSDSICEECGKPGKLYSDGWCVTRCEPCLKKRRGYE